MRRPCLVSLRFALQDSTQPCAVVSLHFLFFRSSRLLRRCLPPYRRRVQTRLLRLFKYDAPPLRKRHSSFLTPATGERARREPAARPPDPDSCGLSPPPASTPFLPKSRLLGRRPGEGRREASRAACWSSPSPSMPAGRRFPPIHATTPPVSIPNSSASTPAPRSAAKKKPSDRCCSADSPDPV
ncbi:unnamed protein product [Urochloa humidicola]